MTENPESAKFWAKTLAPYRTPSDAIALRQLAETLIPLVALTGLMLHGYSVGWWWVFALMPLASIFLVRTFVLQHDCGHGSLFRTRWANDLVGSLLGVLTLTPYYYWKRTHAIHHATSGNLDRRDFGDIDTITVAEYRALSPLRRLGYRAYRHPLVFLGLGALYQFVLKHRLPLDAPWSWRREWASVAFTNLGLGALVWAIGANFGWTAILAVQLPYQVLAAAGGIWLFYVQHQFEGGYWRRQDEWDFHTASLIGSSYYALPAWLHWLTADISVHHIHHLASKIPNYRLQKAFREVPELQKVTRLGLRQSLRCAKLKLWDEERRRVVGWRAVEERAEAPLGAAASPNF
jgi:omega-6 fatty acid desaturase (delta-12 desaturase)